MKITFTNQDTSRDKYPIYCVDKHTDSRARYPCTTGLTRLTLGTRHPDIWPHSFTATTYPTKGSVRCTRAWGLSSKFTEGEVHTHKQQDNFLEEHNIITFYLKANY